MRSRHFLVLAEELGFMWAFATVAGAQAAPEETPPANAQPAGAPVLVGSKTLFFVPARMLTFSPEDRAQTIAARVEWISRQSPASIRAVHTENGETTTAIVSEDTMIDTITESDAQASGKARQEPAQLYALAIQASALALRENAPRHSHPQSRI